jgi:hypothetical protein
MPSYNVLNGVFIYGEQLLTSPAKGTLLTATPDEAYVKVHKGTGNAQFTQSSTPGTGNVTYTVVGNGDDNATLSLLLDAEMLTGETHSLIYQENGTTCFSADTCRIEMAAEFPINEEVEDRKWVFKCLDLVVAYSDMIV